MHAAVMSQQGIGKIDIVLAKRERDKAQRGVGKIEEGTEEDLWWRLSG